MKKRVPTNKKIRSKHGLDRRLLGLVDDIANLAGVEAVHVERWGHGHNHEGWHVKVIGLLGQTIEARLHYCGLGVRIYILTSNRERVLEQLQNEFRAMIPANLLEPEPAVV